MLRIVLLLILVALAVRFVWLLARSAAEAVRAGGAPRSERVIPLVACRDCGVLVPRERAVAAGDRAWLCRGCSG